MLWFFMFMALYKIQLLVNWGKYFIILVIDISESQGFKNNIKDSREISGKTLF